MSQKKQDIIDKITEEFEAAHQGVLFDDPMRIEPAVLRQALDTARALDLPREIQLMYACVVMHKALSKTQAALEDEVANRPIRIYKEDL